MQIQPTFSVLPWAPGIEQHESSWKELWQKLGAAPDLHPYWFKSLVDTHDIDVSRLYLLTAHFDSDLRMIWPFLNERVILGGIYIYRIRPLQDIHCMHGGLLSTESPLVSVQNIRRGLSAAGVTWDMMILSDQVEGDSITDAWKFVAQANGSTIEVNKTSRPPYLNCSGNIDDLLKSRSSNFRSIARRRLKAVKNTDRYNIKTYKTTSSLSDFFSAVIDIEQTTWKHRNGSAISSRPWEEAFYRRLLSDFCKIGLTNCSVLFEGQTPIAHDIELRLGGKVYGLKHSINENHKSSGPGIMLRAARLEAYLTGGIKEFDFLGTDEPHKLQWTDTTRQHCTLRIVEQTSRGKFIKIILKLRRLIKRAHAIRVPPGSIAQTQPQAPVD